MISQLKGLLPCAWIAIAALPFVARAQQAASVAATATPPLQKILIADSLEAASRSSAAPETGFVVLSPELSFLDGVELAKRLASGKGRTIDQRLLAAIALVVENFAQQRDFPAATAIIPPQDITGGIVRVALLAGKIRDIKMQGAHWFSESLLQEKLRIEKGETVRISELDRAITWTNSNPFRRVRVHIERIPGTGEADLIVNVEDQRPVRLSATYDNTGNEILGESRYAAGVTFGNAWGRDHLASYQFITSDKPDVFRAHAGEYRVPLAWRHVFSLSGSYLEAQPTFEDGAFTQKGRSITADAKYLVPFEKGRWRAELSSAISFKRTNNNLEFYGIPQIGATIDVLTGNLSVAGMRPDKRGNWVASAALVGSPGEFNSRSSPSVYDQSGRAGANPRFAYTLLSFQRNTILTPNLVSSARAMVQFSSANLVPTEQFSLGGLATVRGYEERILSGDGGYSFTHELQQRLPVISLGKRMPKLETVGVFFWDYGRVLIKHPEPGQRHSDYLASVGIGFRASLKNYLSASVDYARQLEKVEIPGVAHDRIHVRVTLSY